MLMFSLNETTLKQTNIKAYAVHPGLVKTPIGTKHASRMHAFFWRLFTKRGMHPNEALSSYHYLIDAKTHPENLYYYQAKAIKYAKLIDNQKNRDTLFQKTKDDLKTITQKKKHNIVLFYCLISGTKSGRPPGIPLSSSSKGCLGPL